MSHDAEAPSSYRMKEDELSSANSQELGFNATHGRVGSNPQKRKMQNKKSTDADHGTCSVEATGYSMRRTTVKYDIGEDGENSTMTLSTPMTSAFVNDMDKVLKESNLEGEQVWKRGSINR